MASLEAIGTAACVIIAGLHANDCTAPNDTANENIFNDCKNFPAIGNPPYKTTTES